MKRNNGLDLNVIAVVGSAQLATMSIGRDVLPRITAPAAFSPIRAAATRMGQRSLQLRYAIDWSSFREWGCMKGVMVNVVPQGMIDMIMLEQSTPRLQLHMAVPYW